MAALLIGGALEGIDRLKRKRAAKRASVPDPSGPSRPASPTIPPPPFSSSNPSNHDSALLNKEHLRDEELAHLEHPALRHSLDTPSDEADAPPPYQAPPYERHRSDTLLESARPTGRYSQRPQPPSSSRRSIGAVPSSSSQAPQEEERRDRTPCLVGPDGRCACGKQEQSPGAPLGETVKERRERKWREMWSFGNPNFWALMGVSLAR